jgi:hypothetical protein
MPSRTIHRLAVVVVVSTIACVANTEPKSLKLDLFGDALRYLA